jgi:hypothetical protein
MKIRLSIKSNLLVEVNLDDDLKMKNAGIQSYTTMVGFIEDGKVTENGKYSRTTGKHMSFIRAITELPVVSSKEKRYFGWLWDGVKIAHEDSISSASSLSILKDLSKGKSFFESVASLDKMARKDLAIVNEILEHKDLKEAFESYRKIKKNSFALI